MNKRIVWLLVIFGALSSGCPSIRSGPSEPPPDDVGGLAGTGTALSKAPKPPRPRVDLVPNARPGYPAVRQDGRLIFFDCRPAQRFERFNYEIPPYQVWYGTNRAPLDKDHLKIGFSEERDGVLRYGMACVHVPKSHSFGSVGSWWVTRLVKGTDDRLTIESINPLERDQFIRLLKDSLESTGEGPRKALIYIHGYNVTFEEAVIRAAQIGYDLKVEGITAVYSWPSKGSLLGYAADEATVESSEQFAKEFLELVALQSGAEEVDVIAHSMGNRALLRAVSELAPAMKRAGKKFGQIFLAAPDVDVDTFKQLAHVYPYISRRKTLYVSSGDLALKASAVVHGGYSRAGFYPPITSLPGIDTVQVSNVDLTVLGHGYFSTLEPVLHDMFDLMRSNLAPHDRIRLRPRPSETSPRYWEIAP